MNAVLSADACSFLPLLGPAVLLAAVLVWEMVRAARRRAAERRR